VTASHFDTIANGYDEALPAHVVEHYLRKSTRFVVEHCPRGRGLDVGCGTGVRADRLAQAGYEMVGVDSSQGMLDVAASRAPRVARVNASATSLPFADETFDLVITVAVLHHIADADDVRQTLAEMVRVTRRASGRIVVWDHNPRNPYWRRLMGRVLQDTGEERLIPERELLDGLRTAGGKILLSRQLSLVPDFTPLRTLRLAAAVERAVESTPVLNRFAAHNVIVATK